ncbi:hypothetical protein K8Z61_09465 [Nocardioides sp. TRM66260-LWL]|uniref:hypothetical protein n=1 Tax=Nocardioides sp. TRM66260-LWL TaxID=2874478 RepID=UPI001CC35971|nr:hypothetical protein [Nocardioides sp. TRM66260-LWL]MBZ5734723.1 hypothetical protein [Nocardioides sp. TRM66260-LWL]
MSARSRRGSVVSWVASGACLIGAVLVLSPLGGAPASGAQASSAVTVQGTGRFADLKVTVSQTEHLINQVVDVKWSGGKQTTPTTGGFSSDYLQIMQCWGDDPAGPDRRDCQFGALSSDTRGGNWATSRQVDYGSTLKDPNERATTTSIPFRSVSGVTVPDAPNQFFDAYSTNELPFARTYADGTGEEHVEIQTVREAPGLGCGARLEGGKVRDCWLVIVPRDDVDADGSKTTSSVQSSPLSQSNWDQRLVVRLHFDPVGLACPIGTPERRLVGQEEVSEAVSRWQPVLCQETGSIFGFSQINDDLARAQTLAADPWLSFVSKPLDPENVADGRSLSYAPVSVSGVGIAFNIDGSPTDTAPEDEASKAGARVPSLRLNARLVAKLLTQSYRLATLDPDKLGRNPLAMGYDPEFKQLNPGLSHQDIRALARITVPVGQTDAFAELWRWVAADRSARAFLNGDPDPWGMTVNAAYKGLDLTRSDFPLSDLTCRTFDTGTPDLCPLDAFAYAADIHDGTRAAARGSTLARTAYTPGTVGGYKLAQPQLSGTHAVLAVSDTATAARYQLPMASLQNAAGRFVAPDRAGLAAGLDSLKPSSVAGVEVPDPTSSSDAAYPLTHVTYAVTSPEHLTGDEATAYSRFLTYVATKGQVLGAAPGLLPDGYVPLPAAMRARTLAMAKAVGAAATASPSASPSASSSVPPATVPSTPVDAGGGVVPPATGLPAGPDASAPAAPGAAPSAPASGAASASPTAPATALASTVTTPGSPAGGSRYALAALLLLTAAVLIARSLTGARTTRAGP